jgi:hypothetical protein
MHTHHTTFLSSMVDAITSGIQQGLSDGLVSSLVTAPTAIIGMLLNSTTPLFGTLPSLFSSGCIGCLPRLALGCCFTTTRIAHAKCMRCRLARPDLS